MVYCTYNYSFHGVYKPTFTSLGPTEPSNLNIQWNTPSLTVAVAISSDRHMEYLGSWMTHLVFLQPTVMAIYQL